MSGALSVLTSFDDEEVLSKHQADAMALETAVAEARDEAYQEGYAAGEAAAQLTSDEVRQALAGVSAALQTLVDQAPQKIAGEAAGLAKCIIEAAYPQISERGFAQEVAMQLAAISGLESGRQVTLTVHEQYAEQIQLALEELTQTKSLSLNVVDSIPAECVEARWKNGGAKLDVSEIVTSLLKTLDNFVIAPTQENNHE